MSFAALPMNVIRICQECATDALTLEMRAVRQSLTSAGFPGAESLVLLPL